MIRRLLSWAASRLAGGGQWGKIAALLAALAYEIARAHRAGVHAEVRELGHVPAPLELERADLEYAKARKLRAEARKKLYGPDQPLSRGHDSGTMLVDRAKDLGL